MATATRQSVRFRRPSRSLGIELRLLCGVLLLVAGCHVTHTVPVNQASVACQVQLRTGQILRLDYCACRNSFPPGAALEDGVTEEEAVAIALWNNAAFQEVLVDFGIARSDLVQAGLLPNPELAYFFPVSDKPFKYAVDVPIEALWLRPIRVAAAGRELNRTTDRLTQAALDLIRDVRQSYADTLLAQERARIARRNLELRAEVSELAEARLRAGDASAQESATARIDALQARQDLTRIEFEIPIVEERFRNLLGIGAVRTPLLLNDVLPTPQHILDIDPLLAEALRTRPDALAAYEAQLAAAERVRLSRLGWIRFLGIADATSGRDTGHELSPALRVMVPLFNWNQGAISRAESELQRAQRQRQTVHNQIILDVRRSYAQYGQARYELELLQSKVRPEVEANIRRAQNAFKNGNTSYLFVLESTRQLVDSYLREAQLHADVRRAWAELERSVGFHLVDPHGVEATVETLPPVQADP